MACFRASALLLIASFWTLPLPADDSATANTAPDARVLINKGVAAFNEGELERARLLLERARAAGVDSASLQYNMGVLYYRMELYDRARKAFQSLLGSSHQDLALYNLGLVAKAAGQNAVAQRYFERVADQAGQDKLRKLARLALQQTGAASARRWVIFASLGGGYEDNLALLPETAPSDISDSFNEALLVGNGAVWSPASDKGRSDSLDLSGSVYRRHYHSEEEFSNDALQLGAAWVSRGEDDRAEVGLQQSYFRIGGDSREFQTTLAINYRRRHCRGDSVTDRCGLTFEVARVTAFETFEGYEGMRYRLGGFYQHYGDTWEASARVRLEDNDRDDIAEGGQFVSLSPRRYEFGLGFRYTGWANLSVGPELGYRYSDYADPNQRPEAEGRDSGSRIDHRYSAGIRAIYDLSADWSITAEGTYRENDSSLQQFDYDNQVYQLSLGYLF
ncbi:MAG: outer membrane beta-barrel protein [Oleiphilaceae bacterium]|nr:outer membrane beta-barrel protein [Oleiphilaceae bacterium]